MATAKPHTSIFVSYSRVDIEFKDRLVAKLRRAYEQVWTDTEELRGGEVWWDKIVKQIRKSDIFLYLLSPDSIISFFCRAELSEAIRLQKQIVPVLIRPRTQIPKYIGDHHQVVDMSTGITVDAITELFAAIIYRSYDIDRDLPPLWDHSSPLPGTAFTLSVPSHLEPSKAEQYLNTGMLLLPGDKITLTASGKVTVDSGKTWMSPNGVYPHPETKEPIFVHTSDAYAASGFPQEEVGKRGVIGSLIGWVGTGRYAANGAFFVGEHLFKEVDGFESGFLYLAVNDTRDMYSDNQGAFSVTFEMYRD